MPKARGLFYFFNMEKVLCLTLFAYLCTDYDTKGEKTYFGMAATIGIFTDAAALIAAYP